MLGCNAIIKDPANETLSLYRASLWDGNENNVGSLGQISIGTLPCSVEGAKTICDRLRYVHTKRI